MLIAITCGSLSEAHSPPDIKWLCRVAVIKKYRVHRFDLSMTRDQLKLEDYLNQLEGEVIAIFPNVTPVPATFVDFVLIVEKLS